MKHSLQPADRTLSRGICHNGRCVVNSIITPINKGSFRTVVIAGAGASAPLGYSTLVDFETAIAKYAPHDATAKDRRELAVLFQKVRQSLVSQGQYTDFEAILAQFGRYLDTLKTLRTDQFLASEFLKSVPDRFRYSAFWQRVGQGQDIVDRIILDHYAEKPTQLEGVKTCARFLEELVSANGGMLDYFTTNYDLGIELAAQQGHLSIPVVTGLNNPLAFRGTWDSQLLETQRVKRKGLYIHRLHGCVRWFCRTTHHASCYSRRILAYSGVPEDRSFEACLLYPGRKLRISVQPYADAFRRLRDSLHECSLCLVIGTSFRDNNIVEYLLEANDRRSQLLPVVIVDINDVRPRFFDRIRRVRDETYFQYLQQSWKVRFLVGDYLEPVTQKRIFASMAAPNSIHVEDEPHD